jgi:hypothetical protein
MKEQPYLPVNWTDGMKINKSHFISQENSFIYMLAQNTSSLLNEFNYGLLPYPGNGGRSIKLFLSIDNQQQVHLRVQDCRAITRGGVFIGFEEDTALSAKNLSAPVLNLSVPFQQLKGKTSSFYVVISVNPYVRIPSGSPDPVEQPTRLPYSTPSIELSILPVEETGKNQVGLFHLPVGKIRIDEQKVWLDEDYIPPCCSVSSHYELLEIHAGLEQFYGKMELYTLQIIQKILQKKQLNDMSSIVQKLCENITNMTAAQIAEIKTLSLHQPPVYLINKVSSLARIFKNTLDFYIGSGKEEFINYCTEWCGVNQAELESSITSLSNHQYDHLDLGKSVETVTEFTKTISNLFASLARLDYIGKKKDPGIYVPQNVVNPEAIEPPKKRRSFLGD